MNLHDSDEAGIQVVRLRFFGVKNLYWIRSAGDGEDGSFIEILRELHSIQCSWCHNKLHVCALLYSLTNTRRDTQNPFCLWFSIKSEIKCRKPLLTFLRRPKRTSVWIVLSWASSNMIMAYWPNSESIKHSLNNIPSVMYLITVSGLVQSSKRIV